MPFRRRRISWRPLGRRLCAGVTLVAYLCAALGVPLPAHASPCGGDSCCCPAETKSRHQCCCSAGEQEPGDSDCCKDKHESSSQPPTKAKARCPYCDPQPEDVTPPNDARAKAPKGTESSTDTNSPKTGPSSDHPKPAKEHKDDAHGFKLGWRLGMSVLKCQGLTVLWVTSGAATMADAPLSWRPDLPARAWLTHSTLGTLSHAAAPEVPPPRAPIL